MLELLLQKLKVTFLKVTVKSSGVTSACSPPHKSPAFRVRAAIAPPSLEKYWPQRKKYLDSYFLELFKLFFFSSQ